MPEQVFIAVTTGKVPEVVGFAEVSRRTFPKAVRPARSDSWKAGMSSRLAGDRASGARWWPAARHGLNRTPGLGFDEVEVIRCFRKDLVP
jgi:hypothetical protein